MESHSSISLRERRLAEWKARKVRESESGPIVYEFVEWDTLINHLYGTWKQGEHFAIVGPTGAGKTTFESRILPIRKYVVIFVTKIYDDTLTGDFPGFERIEKWPPKSHQDKVLLWPRLSRKETIRDIIIKQRRVFQSALDRIFKDRHWTVVFDEQHYMCQVLKLEPENAMYLHQGRSSGLTVVNGTQRPAWVPVVTYSSASHAAIWNTNYRDDLKRLSDLGGLNSRELENNIQRLGKHEFIYVNTRQGDVMRSQVRR
jgi:hypothetical protein